MAGVGDGSIARDLVRFSTTRSGTILLSLGCVSLLSAPDALGQAPFTFQEELRLEPPEATFADVSDVDMLSTGDLWIVDGQTGELWIADDGDLRRVATAGPGPGELRPGAIELVVLPGDTVLVLKRRILPGRQTAR